MISTSIPADTSLHKSQKRAGGLIAGGWRWGGKAAPFYKNVVLCLLVLSICGCWGVYKHCNAHHFPQGAKLLIIGWKAPLSPFPFPLPSDMHNINHTFVHAYNIVQFTKPAQITFPRSLVQDALPAGWLGAWSQPEWRNWGSVRSDSNHTPHQIWRLTQPASNLHQSP